MATGVLWTIRAIAEAEDWIEWLSGHSVKAALSASEELILRTDRLLQFTQLGRIGRISGTRELSLPKWHKVVVYEVLDEKVVILALRDTRQNPASL
jgi:toxin ParE1/3/4